MDGDPTIQLRDVVAEDLPDIFEQQADPIACEMAQFESRDEESFLTHWRQILADDDVIKQAILVDDAFAGYLACFESEGRHLIGYWIDREFWGQGVASAALAEFLTLGYPRPLYAFVAQTNVASMRVLEKCGFELLAERQQNGVDEFLYVLESGR